MNSIIHEVEEKFDEKYTKIEVQSSDKVSLKEFSNLENQCKKQMEVIYEENLMKEMYDKPLNLLIHGLEQGGPNPGPRATSGPRQHFFWPAEDSAKILEKLRESLSEI